MKSNVPTTSADSNKSEVGLFGYNTGDFHNLMNYFWNYVDMPLKNELSDMEPKIEVAEKENKISVTAELPGIDEKDVDLKLSSDGYLTISGEKKGKNQTEGKGRCFSEISYGMFKRTIPLPWDLNYEAATADYADGVLTVEIPKLPEEKQKVKKISITKSKSI